MACRIDVWSLDCGAPPKTGAGLDSRSNSRHKGLDPRKNLRPAAILREQPRHALDLYVQNPNYKTTSAIASTTHHNWTPRPRPTQLEDKQCARTASMAVVNGPHIEAENAVRKLQSS